MISFMQFIQLMEDQNSQEKGIFGNIPGNPAFGGKKPSDGRGKNPYLNNQPSAAGGAGATQQQQVPMMMKKKMNKK